MAKMPSFVNAQPFSSTPIVGDNFGDSDGGGGGGDEGKAPVQTTPLAEAKVKEMYAQTAYDEAKKRESEGKSAAEKARQAAIYEEYKPQLTQKFEPFQAPKDTFQGLASLGMMMMAVGSMGGKKGLTSATGAMNAIAGMANGYQQGRKEEFDRQKQIFEENYKIMKENQAQIEKEFQYALKYAQRDLSGATAKLANNLQARGMGAAAQGLTGGTETITSAHDKIVGPMKKTMSQMDQYKEKLLAAKADVTRAEEYAKTQTVKGAGRFAIVGGVQGYYTPQQLSDATAQGIKVEEIAKGGRAPALSKAGQQIGGILDEQTPESSEKAIDYINRYGVTSADQKAIPAEWNAIKQADDVAKYIAQNQGAIGPLAQVLGKIGEPASAVINNVKSLFGSDPSGTQANNYLRDKSAKIDQELDAIAQADPTKKDDVAAAKIASKKLFSLALADAVAVGRPTVFLERALSQFYSPTITAPTLVEIIKSRAEEANNRLPPVFRADTSKNPPSLLTMSNEDFMRQGAPKAPSAPTGGVSLPPEAIKNLKEGQITTFGNGQKWTLENGQPVQIKE